MPPDIFSELSKPNCLKYKGSLCKYKQTCIKKSEGKKYPSGCCNQQESFRPRAAFQQKSASAGPVECLELQYIIKLHC